jgi:adenylate cyclase
MTLNEKDLWDTLPLGPVRRWLESALHVDSPRRNRRRLHVRCHRRDGALFVNDEYVIRGVAGRLLRHFLCAYAENGTTEFFNRDVRRQQSLLLPADKDNLEARLILLERRLVQKQLPVRVARRNRGCISLMVDESSRLRITDVA